MTLSLQVCPRPFFNVYVQYVLSGKVENRTGSRLPICCDLVHMAQRCCSVWQAWHRTLFPWGTAQAARAYMVRGLCWLFCQGKPWHALPCALYNRHSLKRMMDTAHWA